MKHHHNSHVALLIIAFAALVFVSALYGYMYYTINASLARVFAAREAVQKERSYQMQQESLNELYADTAADRLKLASFFVPENGTVPFIEVVESLGKNTGSTVTLSSIVADDISGSTPGTLGRISIQVEARGSWASVMRTLAMAEALPYKSSVKNVRLDASLSGQGTTATREWRLTFILEAVTMRGGI